MVTLFSLLHLFLMKKNTCKHPPSSRQTFKQSDGSHFKRCACGLILGYWPKGEPPAIDIVRELTS